MSIFDKIKAWLGVPRPEPSASEAATPPAPGPIAPTPVVHSPPQPAPPEPPAAVRRRTSPREDARIEGEARALFDAGRPAEGIALLNERTIVFARHEVTSLPCLCRACLRPDASDAEHEGIAFVRDFVVTRHRAFFYWMPAELAADVKQVRASMRAAVRERLRVRASKEDHARVVINPFTKQPLTIPPKAERRRVNPFTGKPVP